MLDYYVLNSGSPLLRNDGRAASSLLACHHKAITIVAMVPGVVGIVPNDEFLTTKNRNPLSLGIADCIICIKL